jgi:hypothetical protein
MLRNWGIGRRLAAFALFAPFAAFLWELQDAFGINRPGMVVDEGIHNGDLHAYLLSLR